MGFISEEGLKQLDKYKYVSGGYSWLDNKMNPFWTAFVELLPIWMAPNLVTFIGFLFLISHYLIMLAYDCTVTQDVPNWVFFYSAAMIFIYQTLDAVDGKQARRTKSSSPLGQLFDHGCDTFSMTFLMLGVTQAVKLPLDKLIVIYPLIQIIMWLANWMENHTKVLPTHFNNLGVTEGEFLVIGFHIITGIFGQDIWSQPLKNVIPNFIFNSLKDYSFWSSLFNGPIYLPCYYVVVFLAVVLSVGMFVQTLPKAKDMVEATFQWFPMVVIIITESLWIRIDAYKPIVGLILLTFGLLFSLVCCKIIVCSVTEMRFPRFSHVEVWIPVTLAVILLAFHSQLTPRMYLAILIIQLVSNLVCILTWVSSVINQITRHLGIYCFTLEKRKKE